MPELRSVEEHLDGILAATEPLPATEVALLDALDLAASDDVVAPIRLPRFDNSAMDGYAVRSEDVAAVTDAAPVTLPVVGAIGAGRPGAVTAVPPGSAAKIMTGAPLPPGADSVVPYESTDRGAQQVVVRRGALPGQHVRYAGEDVAEGALILPAGTALGPRQLGLLASVGLPTVRARRRPRVLVVSTGSELRDPGEPLEDDSIYDGNSILLAGAVQRAGAVAVRAGRVADSTEAFLQVVADHLDGAEGVDVVVTSGGISMGDFDVVKAALSGGGASDGPLAGDVWFGGLAMQPGKPQGFGRVWTTADPQRRVPFFALPGNPVSSYLSFEMFVRPALRAMMGRAPYSRRPITARLTHAVTSPPGRRQFLRGVLTLGPDGTSVTEVQPVGGSGSHLVGDLAASDALIVVPEDTTAVGAGERVTVIRLDQD
ncbi:molybdotransferase-like divisome protein Glp [Nocardioides sp. GXZ039]|uniref:molybdotransferase-like divisome protein Glp n=1 Tax=Nocardioides sp. GXZ039 TaxID=3136018 RepID=UPI0030F44ED0